MDEPTRPARACKKPCHDCPFRTDIFPYQSPAQVHNNVAAVEHPYRLQHCHHSERPGKTPVVCAGFLSLVEGENPADARLQPYNFNPHHGVPVFRCLKQFRKLAHLVIDATLVRRWAWFFSQPANTQQHELNTRPQTYKTPPDLFFVTEQR